MKEPALAKNPPPHPHSSLDTVYVRMESIEPVLPLMSLVNVVAQA